jgi:UDP-glucose 4-epimerase
VHHGGGGKPMILITGGLGYLGGRLAVHLASSGFAVRIATRNIPIAQVFKSFDIDIVAIDLMNEDTLRAACKGVTAIIHLAAMNAVDCSKNPDLAFEINGNGTARLLRASVQEGVKKFIYFSTAHVYGQPLQGYINENTLPHPLHPYAITHRVAEDFVLDASVKDKIQGLVFRLSNAVGPPVFANTNCWMLFLNDICKQSIQNDRIKVHSNGNIERDFIAIETVTAVVEQSLADTSILWGFPIINLSSGESLSLNNVAVLVRDKVRELLDKEIIIDMKIRPLPRDAPKLQLANDLLQECVVEEFTPFQDEVDKLLMKCQHWFAKVDGSTVS